MELTTIENKLWDSFKEALWTNLQRQASKMPEDLDSLSIIMLIESTIDISRQVIVCYLIQE